MGPLRKAFRITGRAAVLGLVACGDPLVSVDQRRPNEGALMASVDGGMGEAPTGALTSSQPAGDETRCIIGQGGRLYFTELETGRLGRPLNAYSDSIASLGWVDDHVYAYDAEEQSIAKISAIDGAVEVRSLAGLCPGLCAVANWGSRLVLYLGRQISIFASFDDIPNAPLAQYPSEMQAENVAIVNDELLGAWHSTDEIDVFDLVSGTDRPPISLVDYDDWIYGLGVTQSGEVAMIVPDDVIQIRDRQTGAIVRSVPMRWSAGANQQMACGGVSPPIEQRAAPPADPVSVQAVCGPSGYSTFDSGASRSPSLHVVSVSRPTESGVVNVHVDRPGDAILVLVAGGETSWSVTQGPNTNLIEIIVQGNELQTLTAPAGVTTEVEARADGGAPTLSYSSTWYSYPARKLRFEVEQMTHLPMRSFTGCSEGSSFTIE